MNLRKINKDEFFVVKAEITEDGISVVFRGKAYKIVYPKKVWESYSTVNKEVLLDNLAFMHTCHLSAATKKQGVVYTTALPCFETQAFKSTMYDIPSVAYFDKEPTTDAMRRFFNAQFLFASYDTVLPEVKRRKLSEKHKPTAVIPFTAGKESLLSMGLCLELGIRPILVYIDDTPGSPESKHKERILARIREEYGVETFIVENEPARLRKFSLDGEENNWGFGTQLLSYLITLMPFVEKYDADYVLFGNEYSCDEYAYDAEQFKSSFWYDQRTDWTRQLNIVGKMLTSGTLEVGSFVAPLYEFGIVKVLHSRYPLLAPHQSSCFSDGDAGTENVWCEHCSKCAWNYAFFRGIGIDTARLGFSTNMFRAECRKYYSIFESEDGYNLDETGHGVDEQALAFFLAIERGDTGELLDEFKRMPLYEQIRTNAAKLLKRFFSLYETPVVPYELKERILDLYDETLEGKSVARDVRPRPVAPPAPPPVEEAPPVESRRE